MIKLSDLISIDENEINTIKQALNLFPDLEKKQNRWKTVFYTSKSINEKLDNVSFSHSCGCCPDSPLFAKFYHKILINGKEFKIYPDYYEICIGER